jgi:hypothetical protein
MELPQKVNEETEHSKMNILHTVNPEEARDCQLFLKVAIVGRLNSKPQEVLTVDST